MNNLTQNQQNNNLSANGQKKGVAVNTPSGGDGNTPLNRKVDVARRILSKQFSDLSTLGQNTCPIGGVSVNVDYLQTTGLLTVHRCGNGLMAGVEELFDFIKSFFGDSFIDQGEGFKNGCWRYQKCYKTVNGIIFAYGLFKEGIRYYLQIPGVPLRKIEVTGWKRLISGLVATFAAKFTRIDICVDDYKRRVTGKRLVQLCKKGDVARVKSYCHIESGAIGSESESTVYFGSGRKQIYFYNAEFLHKFAADRWEARFREDRAHIIATHIADEYQFDFDKFESYDAMNQEMLRYLGGCCLGAVDFVKRNGDTDHSLSNFARYGFYESLVQDVGAIQHIPVPKPLLDTFGYVCKKLKWLNKSVFRTIASLYTALGDEDFNEYLNDEIRSGSARFDQVQLEWTAKIKDFFDSIDYDSGVSKLAVINALKFT